MLIRIVNMTFRPEAVDEFLAIFDGSSEKIRSFPGCRHLELWRDAGNPNAFTTYSHWDDEQALETYRKSALFTSTWARTKILFAESPSVHSYLQIRPLSAGKTA